MERTLTSTEVAEKLGIPKSRFYTLLKSGQIPCTRQSPRKTFFNLQEVRAALAEKNSARPVDDENHPEFDEMDRSDEETIHQCQAEAFEAAQEASISVFLDYIQRARKQKNRPLVKRLVEALAQYQHELDEEE